MQKRLSALGIRNWVCFGMLSSYRMGNPYACNRRNTPRISDLLEKVGVYVKMVLIKSPKLLAPILRAVFGVKKIHYEN